MLQLKRIRMVEARTLSKSSKKLCEHLDSLMEGVQELAEVFEAETCIPPNTIFTDISVHKDLGSWEYNRSTEGILSKIELPTKHAENEAQKKADLTDDTNFANTEKSALRAWLKSREKRRF